MNVQQNKRCRRCGGTLYIDDLEVKCIQCSEVDRELKPPKRRKPSMETIETDKSKWSLESDEESVEASITPQDSELMAQFKSTYSTHKDQLDEVKEKLKFEHKTKAYLALEDSDTEDYGIIRDTQSDVLWVSGQGETVGVWTRSKADGLIHISLLPSIEALYDSAVRIWSKYAEERKLAKTGVKRTYQRKSKPKDTDPELGVQQPAPGLSDHDKIQFNDMRARIMELKKI